MRRHEARCLAAGIYIPGTADIQGPPVGRLYRTIHDIADAVARLLYLGHLILLGVPDQSHSQLRPSRGGKPEPEEEVGLALLSRER